MVDFGLKRNGSGYYDETPYKAVMGMPKPGEVWSTTQDKLFLVLKNHGQYCTTLALNETNRNNECLAITVEYPLYTNPRMLGYTFNTFFSEYIKRIPDDQFLNIMEEVGAGLGVTIKTVLATEADSTKDDWIRTLESDCERLRAERDKSREAEKLARAEMMVWKERAENLVPVAAPEAPDPSAEMYRKMYYELLDRIICRGNAG